MPGLPAWMVEPAPAEVLEAETVDMRVVARRDLSEGVVAIELRSVAGEDAPAWAPGAHVDLHLPDGAIRQYSICGPAEDLSRLTVAVLREAAGRGGSLHLHDVTRVGDVLPVSAPRNHFGLEPSPAYRFVAGGIGITPIVPMIAQAERAGARWTLLYGGRSRRSMAFLAELAADARVTVVPEDELGRPDLAAALAAPEPETLIYCCGPEPLLRAVEEVSAHWPPGTLRVERFTPRQDVPDGAGTAFTVELRRSGLELTIAPGRSVLDTVREAGVRVPSSCREGTCGSCETLVLAGEPEHRDSILTPAEQAANDCMMLCVSRARSERLVLDL